MEAFFSGSFGSIAIQVVVVGIALIVGIVSFALLIPLDSIQSVTGVTIILSVAYCLSLLAWVIAVAYYSKKPEELQWLNTHLIFLVLLPATIGATAMNVTTVQNTRNLLAAKIAQ
jgi:hypothetical protein